MFAANLVMGIVALCALAGAGTLSIDAGITLDNRWGIPLDLWVDRAFSCHAPKGSTCAVRTQSGTHEVQARNGDIVIAREFVDVKAGESFSYRVEKGHSPNL